MNLRTSMVNNLVENGSAISQWVQEAFLAVPRETFVPRFHRRTSRGSVTEIVDGDDPSQRREWLNAVYSDVPLVVQATPAADVQSHTGLPTSSSSMPSVMAGMLEALDLQPVHRVLEIGTGTGYNAALLCHRVGDKRVISVELHPQLAHSARTALASLDVHPEIVVGDGVRSVDQSERFDRIIVTAAIDHIPPSWIDLLGPNGRIVADVRGSMDGGIAALDRMDDGVVEGRFLAMDGAFMPMRTRIGSPHRDGEDWTQVLDKTNPHRGFTTVDPRLLNEPGMRFLAQLHLSGLRVRGFLPDPECVDDLSGRTTTGSWADVALQPDDAGRYPVSQGGPHRIWDTIETAHATWLRLDRPSRTRFGITASAMSGTQHVWIDQPDSADRWPLPL